MQAVFEERVAGPWNDIQDHMQFLHDTVLGYTAPRVIELGVRYGNSCCALLSAALKAGGEMWSCDVNPPYVPPGWEQVAGWHFLLGDSVSPQVLRDMPEQADVVFIDTSHTFSQTVAELRAYVPRVAPGGVVLLHDTQWRFIYEARPQDVALPEPGGFVAEALDAYCAETGLTWQNRLSGPTFYGLGVIRP